MVMRAGRVSGPGVAGRVGDPVMVGRAGQLAELENALGRVRDGSPMTVLIGGEAGIGKTRLVSEFTRRADARILTGGCLELGADGLPFAPFTALLRDLNRHLGPDGIAGLLPGIPGATTAGLARLLPELAAPPGRAPGTDGDGQSRAGLFEQVLTLLEHLADHSPVILTIEDAHWADSASRDLLSFLIRSQQSMDGLLIVVTYRSDELHRTHPLRSLLAELDRISWVRRVEVSPLSLRDTSDLVASITGAPPTDRVLDVVYHRSGGNPLFAETLASSPDLPESLRDLLIAAVRRLPEESQEIVRVASAGGDWTSHRLLATVSGLADDAELDKALRPAVAANVLRTDGDGYLFRHALIREAVHDELLPGERVRLHARYAEAIASDPALVPSGRADVEQAHHWHAAHDVSHALTSAWRAAAAANAVFAYGEQLVMLSRVLELWRQVPDGADRIRADHLKVLETAVDAADKVGDWDRGLAFAEAALREAPASAYPVRRAMLLQARAHMRHRIGRSGYSDDLREALALIPADPPTAARAKVLEALAHEFHHRPRGQARAEFRQITEEALAIARQVGDAATEAAALSTLSWALPLNGPDDVEQVRALFAQARERAGAARDYQQLLLTAIHESDLLEGLGEHEQAADVAREGLAAARKYGLARTSGATLAINLAEPLTSLGRWDEASEVIERALQLLPPPINRVGLFRLTGDIALARGDAIAAAGAIEDLKTALEGAAFKDESHLPLAVLETELRHARGQYDAALSVVSDALDKFDLLPSARYAWPLVVAGARACTAAGADATAVAAEVIALGDRLRAEAAKLDAEGRTQRAHQLTFAALMTPDPSQTADQWAEAILAWLATAEPYPLARVLLHAAGAALNAGDRDGASDSLLRAAALAQDLGARPLADQIADLAQRGHISLVPALGPAQTPGAASPAGLTSRELEVLRLVAAGRSNRDIAADLFISPKTASVHVSNILAKLGVTSRGEAAAAAYRLGLS
jgi:DNA-binding CsgD family transcriptional regulator/tetratricopeptide (TPR) repeat protein